MYLPWRHDTDGVVVGVVVVVVVAREDRGKVVVVGVREAQAPSRC